MKGNLPPDKWRPQGIDELEPVAEDAVRSTRNSVVIAGPGAGKTELLAQRACYLLQTGLCPAPRAILAISFKRDAARNLYERVRLRCGDELARRFHSYTFDAFAKGLLDRFGAALAEPWRPRSDYSLNFKIESQFRNILGSVPSALGGLSSAELAQLQIDRAYKDTFIGRCLSEFSDSPRTLDDRAALSAWRYLLHGGGGSSLNFQMIGRLAEHILKSNPKVLRALRASYAFAFLDEFQDTTAIHYDLAFTAFAGSQTVLTAVGDGKQSIMRWALALRGAFKRFQDDFSAEVFRPLRNYRSAPKLVAFVGHLAAAIEQGATTPEAVDDGTDGEGECRLLLFPNSAAEGETVGTLIEGWIDDGVLPRDICILTRQKPEVYGSQLLRALSAKGIQARVETQLQDLLAEPITTVFVDCLKVATLPQAPESWRRTTELLLLLRGCDQEGMAKIITEEFARFAIELAKGTVGTSPATKDTIVALVRQILTFITLDAVRAHYPQYDHGAYLKDQTELFVAEFAKCVRDSDWKATFDQFEGIDSIPIMTVHKSKGLEYHSVVFLGLEDYVFRGFKRVEDDEESCAFFVALSRARKRVLFTFSKERQGAPQSISTIRPLYDLLVQAGVTPEKIGK